MENVEDATEMYLYKSLMGQKHFTSGEKSRVISSLANLHEHLVWRTSNVDNEYNEAFIEGM